MVLNKGLNEIGQLSQWMCRKLAKNEIHIKSYPFKQAKTLQYTNKPNNIPSMVYTVPFTRAIIDCILYFVHLKSFQFKERNFVATLRYISV